MFQWVEESQVQIKRFCKVVEEQWFIVVYLAVYTETTRQQQCVAAENAAQVNAGDVDKTVSVTMLV